MCVLSLEIDLELAIKVFAREAKILFKLFDRLEKDYVYFNKANIFLMQ